MTAELVPEGEPVREHALRAVRGCEFALCRREAELEVGWEDGAAAAHGGGHHGDRDVFLVCGLHVTPVLTWGLPRPDRMPTIRHLG